MAIKQIYHCVNLTGGVDSTYLDYTDGNSLSDKDRAFVINASTFYLYELNATSGAAESSPNIIAPDTNAGTKRWILITSYSLTSVTTSVTAADNDADTSIATTAYAKSQDAVLHREPDQGVALTAAAIAAIKTTHSAVFSNTTNSFLCGIDAALPTWTPAATQVLRNKWAANVGYKLECLVTSGIFRLTLNATTYDSAVPGGGAASNLVAGTKHKIIAVPTVGATQTTVSFYLDGILLSTTAAQNNVDVTTTGDMYTGGTSAATYAMTVFDVYDYNRALTAVEVLDLYRNGVVEADKWGSQTELMPNQVDRDFSGASAWSNIDLNAYNETTDLTITATAANQYCTCPVASAPTTIGKRYRMEFDVANIVATWTIKSFDGTQTIGTVSANGTDTRIEWTATTTGGYRIVSVATTSSGDFDNFSLVEIGATLAALPESWQADKPYDCSSNNLTMAYPATGWSLTRPPAKSPTQPTPTDGSTGAVTVTIAMILNGIISGNPSAARAYTFETGATSDAWPSLAIDQGHEWSIINTNATYVITLTASSGHTIVGIATVAPYSSARFLTRKTAASTFVTYRIAVDNDEAVAMSSKAPKASPSFTVGIGIGGVAAGTGGVAFPATAVAVADANTLDDYEEGTWTPVPTPTGGSFTTVGAVSGTYTKIGRIVHLRCTIAITTNGTGSGGLQIAGSPFSASTATVAVGWENTGIGVGVVGHILVTTITLWKMSDGTYPVVNGTTFFVSTTFEI